MTNNIIKKITSRKFIIAVITAIVGIITMFIGENETVSTIAGAMMTIIPTVVYCIVEGHIDAESVKTITNATVDVAEKLGADDSTVGVIEQMGVIGGMLTEDSGEISPEISE